MLWTLTMTTPPGKESRLLNSFMRRWSIGLKCDQSVLVWGRKWLVSFLVEIFATFVTIPGRDILWFVLPGSGFSVHSEGSRLTILTSDALLTKTRNVTYYLLPTSILIIAASFSHCTSKILRYQASEERKLDVLINELQIVKHSSSFHELTANHKMFQVTLPIIFGLKDWGDHR